MIPRCRLGGQCDLLLRDADIRPPGPPGVYQCVKCSEVWIAVCWEHRKCDHCGKEWGVSLHDPCLGYIEGVGSACCGHGDPSKAYVITLDGLVALDGEEARRWLTRSAAT